VRGLPFLSDIADFRMLDGVASGRVDIQGSGWSMEGLTKTLSGYAEVDVRDGRLLVDLPSLARVVVSGLLNSRGNDTQVTAFDRASATFQIKDGVMATKDLVLRGQAVVASGSGSIDLENETLAFRINTQLAGGTDLLAGLTGRGLPIILDGPWKSPRVVPDLTELTGSKAGLPVLNTFDRLLKGGNGGVEGLLKDLLSDDTASPRRSNKEP
jgi:AsmA protein